MMINRIRILSSLMVLTFACTLSGCNLIGSSLKKNAETTNDNYETLTATTDSSIGTPTTEKDYSTYYACAQDEESGLYGYIDNTGKYVIEPRFESAQNFSNNGLAAVQPASTEREEFGYGDGLGYIDTTGNFVIDPQFYIAGTFSDNGLAPVKDYDSSALSGYIDSTGYYAIARQFGGCALFAQNGLAPAMMYVPVRTSETTAAGSPETEPETSHQEENPNIVGFIDSTGSFVIEPQFFYTEGFNENGFTIVTIQDSLGNISYGIINSRGEYTVEPQQNRLTALSSNNIAAILINGVNGNGLWGYIDINGSSVIEPQFEYANGFADNSLACVATTNDNGRTVWGYINEQGTYVIEPKFADAGSFSANGIAAVREPGELVGYIDDSGYYVITPQFTSAGEFCAVN